MRRMVMLLVAVGALLAMPMSASAAGGLSPQQLNDRGWTCFNVPTLGVHCAPPGQAFPPTKPTAQLLYFFNTTDPTSSTPDFSGTETLMRDDIYRGQPCPTDPAADGGYHFLGDLGAGVEYWACHRQ